MSGNKGRTRSRKEYLGIGHCEDIIIPQLSFNAGQKKVKKIACGGNHSMLLLEDGTLYGCGDNCMNQLSDDSCSKHWGEWKCLGSTAFKDVACGWDFTAVISHDNKVLSSGCGPKGELGQGANRRKSEELRQIMTVNDGSKIFASLHNCVLVEPQYTNGLHTGSRVYGWGSNTKCQLFEPKSRIASTPKIIYEGQGTCVDYVAMGKDFLILVDVEGQIVNAQGSLPPKFNAEDWRGYKRLQVKCMWTSIHVLVRTDPTKVKKRGIYSFGKDSHGQSFNNDDWSLPPVLEDFNTGSEHGIIAYTNCDAQNMVACWGWGEHGNCGRYQDHPSQQMVNDLSNTVSTLNPIMACDRGLSVKLFGGCATTWIVTTQ